METATPRAASSPDHQTTPLLCLVLRADARQQKRGELMPRGEKRE